MAKEAFTRFGATASLDDIAKKSGVGPGTLYRHFPTRDALIEAVYRSEVEKLAAAERKFSETMPPLDALRAWMLLVVDFIAAKRIIAPALNSVAGGSTKLFEGSRALIQAANDALIKRAIGSGDLRSDLDPPDLLLALIGASHMASRPRLAAERQKTRGNPHRRGSTSLRSGSHAGEADVKRKCSTEFSYSEVRPVVLRLLPAPA